MSTKKKWTLFLIFALFVVALSTSCDSQGKTPAGESGEDTTPLTSESLSQGVLDINYVNNFEGLISILNTVTTIPEVSDETPKPFTILNDAITLGTIQFTDVDNGNNTYSYSASFVENTESEPVGGSVYYSISGNADVTYEKISEGESYFSLTLPNDSKCVINVSMNNVMTLLSATLDKSCALTSTNATVEGRTYDTSEAKLFGIIDEVVSAATEYKTSNATTEIAIDDVTVTCTYNSETSTFTGTWSDGSETYSVDVVITLGDSGNNTLVSAKYDDISLTKDAIDSFNAPQFSGSLIAAL